MYNMKAKLTYFNIPGLGDPVRVMLSVAGIPFEDIRLTMQEWEEMKPQLRWPHLPMLEMDGKTYFQSMAICRHLARKANLTGSTQEEMYLADSTVDTLEDLRKKIIKLYFKPDSPERTQSLKNGREIVIPWYMKNFEEQLKENNGFLVGGKVTWADVIFLSHTDYVRHVLQDDFLPTYPGLKSHVEKLRQLPGIRDWLEVRPSLPLDLRSQFTGDFF